MILLSHPTGNANVRASARAFHSAGWLQELNSCICWDPSSLLARLLPARWADQLHKRYFEGIPQRLQNSHPWRELARLASPGPPLLHRHEYGPLSIDAVYRSFDKHVASRLTGLAGLQAVYAYEDGALSTFQAAESLGLRRFYDLPIAYWRAGHEIFEEERELKPEWACTLTGLKNSAEKLVRKDHELQLAEVVVVPSQFVRSSLVSHGICSAPISVVPFGSPPPLAKPPPHHSSGPLRVLYVGSLGQRKGLAYLLESISHLGAAVELTLIGKQVSPHCRPLLAALERHRWLSSLSRGEVLMEMRRHDVLVLPSLFEGYALVISEAISQGLPVIATYNSGASESIRDGVEGWIVPIRSSIAISERLNHLVYDRDSLIPIRQNCLTRAAELSWASYEQGLREVVAPLLKLSSATPR
jgi:alpha-maltose-1-phosphate synthase